MKETELMVLLAAGFVGAVHINLDRSLRPREISAWQPQQVPPAPPGNAAGWGLFGKVSVSVSSEAVGAAFLLLLRRINGDGARWRASERAFDAETLPLRCVQPCAGM